MVFLTDIMADEEHILTAFRTPEPGAIHKQDAFVYDDITYVDIPTPFKRGDILTWGDNIFVLEHLDSDDP